MNLWKKLERFPPVLVRLLAKNEDGTWMSDEDIWAASGQELMWSDIKRLSYLTRWDDVTNRLTRLFSTTCRVDFANREQMRNAGRYLKDPKFAHLKNDRNFPEAKTMLKIYLQTLR